MPTNSLTDSACKSAKPGARARKMFDGHGLFLFISPAGGKIWRVAYRVDGKQQTKTIGPYPLLSLADARTKRDELRRGLIDGIVPTKAVKAPTVPTFTEAAADYWGGRKDLTAGYLGNVARGLAMHLEPHIGKTPVDAITKEQLLRPMMALDAAGKHVYARRIRVWASQVFDWAVEHGHCPANPAGLIKPKVAFGRRTVQSHASLTLAEVGPFLARLSMERELQSVLACRLLALTWLRTDELRAAPWREVDGDTWRIPAARMKMKRDHIVPLSTQAQAILATLKERCRGSDYIFPGEYRIDRPMSENAILYLIYRIGYKDRMTGHGWRSVASTWANEGGYAPDAIERQLAHAPNDAVRSAYNHAAYLPQRRAMLQDWADWLQQADPGSAQG